MNQVINDNRVRVAASDSDATITRATTVPVDAVFDDIYALIAISPTHHEDRFSAGAGDR